MNNGGPVEALQARLVAESRAVWAVTDPEDKCRRVDAMVPGVMALTRAIGFGPTDGAAGDIAASLRRASELDVLEPGRPEAPKLVHPTLVARRQTGNGRGRSVMLHAIAHIEFNAVNLALDAAWRYPAMPPAFTRDWLVVARDEARHFRMLCAELALEDRYYGDFVAHDGLWAMARRTAPDLTARMALVPRVLEARGLDATPVIQRKLAAVGDTAGVTLLQTLLDEEVRHVRIGDHWFRALCQSAGIEPERRYRELLASFEAPLPKPPVNREARRIAGFSDAELDWLVDIGTRRSRFRTENNHDE